MDWNAVFSNAEFKSMDRADRDAFAGASSEAKIAEWGGLVIVTDLVEREDELKAGEWERKRVFQAFGENGDMVASLELPGFVN